MTEFKNIDIEDKDIFDKFFKEYKFETYEYAFSTLYLWRIMCNVQYAIVDGVLIIKKYEKEKGEYFMEPIGWGEDNLGGIIEYLLDYKSKSSNMPYLFRDIEEEFLCKIKNMYDTNLIYDEDANNFDYIYDAQELIALSGKKYHSKKNHYNSFVSAYEFDILDMRDEQVAKDIIEFSERWNDLKTDSTEELDFEVIGVRDIVTHQEKLDVKGMAVYVDGKIAGFTIGERLNDKMSVIHIEKGDNDFRGIYAFINREFLERYFCDIKYVNREEDLGIEGLRKAKMSYHPVQFAKKYLVDIGR